MLKIKRYTTLLALCAAAACGPPQPASAPPRVPGAEEVDADALAKAADALSAVYDAVAFAHRVANERALSEAGPDPEARRLAVLRVYESFRPLWRTYGDARAAYEVAAEASDAQDAEERERRRVSLVRLVETADALRAVVDQARVLARQPNGAP
jgi:hypothetical protein